MSIKNEARAEILDVLGGDPVILDINFDEKNKDCVKISIGNNSAIVKYTDLFSFMFTIAAKEQQAKMIPVTQELGNEYMKQIRIKCKKDMKEGEELVVNVKIHVPSIVEEQILKTPYLTENVDKNII